MGIVTFMHDIEIHAMIITASIEAQGTVTTEQDYGADLDGNRGIPIKYVDDLNITILDGQSKNITLKLQTKYPEQYKEVVDESLNQLFEEHA